MSSEESQHLAEMGALYTALNTLVRRINKRSREPTEKERAEIARLQERIRNLRTRGEA